MLYLRPKKLIHKEVKNMSHPDPSKTYEDDTLGNIKEQRTQLHDAIHDNLVKVIEELDKRIAALEEKGENPLNSEFPHK